jgi:hypothetical protein
LREPATYEGHLHPADSNGQRNASVSREDSR